jgi:hypothetical protein
MGAKRISDRVMVRRPKGKRPLLRPGLRRKNSIKMNLSGTEWGGGGWTALIY